MAKPADGARQRYVELEQKKPLLSRPQLVKQLIAKPANRSARLGGAAGGIGFIPGIGTGLSVAAVAASTLKLLAFCIESIDLVAHSHHFDMSDEELRQGARLCVLHLSTPERWRVSFAPELPVSAEKLLQLPTEGLVRLVDSSDDVAIRWGVAVASWRLSAAAPFGIGAFAGAWTSYAPVRLSVRSAEQFFAPHPGEAMIELNEEDFLDRTLGEE